MRHWPWTVQPWPRPPPAPTSVAGAALAVEVVDPLHAVLGASGVTGVGQALIHVPLTALAHEAGWAGAAVAAHLVHTGAVVKALGTPGDGVDGGAAVIHVDLTVYACRSTGTVRDLRWPHAGLAPSQGRSLQQSGWDHTEARERGRTHRTLPPNRLPCASGLPRLHPLDFSLLRPTRQNGSRDWVWHVCGRRPMCPLGPGPQP